MTASRAFSGTALALIVALTPAGAHAAAARAVPSSARTREAPAADVAHEAPRDPGATITRPGTRPGGTRPGDNAARRAAAGPPDEQAVYGPPVPKASHGRLAPIAWPDAPGSVPAPLETAIVIVTRTYPSAQSARAAVRAAASDVSAARWTRFPNFSVEAPWLSDNHSPAPQVVVEAPIWTAGRIGASIRRARASEIASSASYVETVQTLALTTVQTYFDIVRLTEREQLLAASLDEHRRLVGTIERRVKQEVSPLADLELARSRAAQVEQDLNQTRAQRLTALRIMAQLVADPSYDIGPIPYYDPALDLPRPDALEDQSATYSPQLKQLDAEVDVAREDFASRRAAIFPQINAQYSYDDFYGHRVGAVIRAQGDGGLANVAQANAARTRIDQAIEDQRAAEVALRRDVASDLIEFQAAKDRAVISLDATRTAAAVSESYMRQYIAGRRSWLDVMNQLREAVNAAIAESEAQVTAMSANARLLIKSGRWRPNFDDDDATTH